MTKAEWYAARHEATYLTVKTKKRTDPKSCLMDFDRKHRRPLTKAERAARARAEGEKIRAAVAGGRGVRQWTRDRDGVVRDERGNVVEGY